MLMVIATDDDDLDEIEMIICFMWKVIAIINLHVAACGVAWLRDVISL